MSSKAMSAATPAVSVIATVYAFTVPSVSDAFSVATKPLDKVTVTAPLVINATASACAALTVPVIVTSSLFKPVTVPAMFALYAARMSACEPVKVKIDPAFTATVVLPSKVFSVAASSDVSVKVTLYALPVPLNVEKLEARPVVNVAVTTPVV